MKQVYILEVEEYNNLLTQTPSNLLQKTIDNLTAKNQQLLATIAEQQQVINTYKLGGVKPRIPTQFSDVIKYYNEANSPAVKVSINYVTKHTGIPQAEVKSILKQALKSQFVDRINNVYIYI